MPSTLRPPPDTSRTPPVSWKPRPCDPWSSDQITPLHPRPSWGWNPCHLKYGDRPHSTSSRSQSRPVPGTSRSPTRILTQLSVSGAVSNVSWFVNPRRETFGQDGDDVTNPLGAPGPESEVPERESLFLVSSPPRHLPRCGQVRRPHGPRLGDLSHGPVRRQSVGGDP